MVSGRPGSCTYLCAKDVKMQNADRCPSGLKSSPGFVPALETLVETNLPRCSHAWNIVTIRDAEPLLQACRVRVSLGGCGSANFELSRHLEDKQAEWVMHRISPSADITFTGVDRDVSTT